MSVLVGRLCRPTCDALAALCLGVSVALIFCVRLQEFERAARFERPAEVAGQNDRTFIIAIGELRHHRAEATASFARSWPNF